MRLSIAIFLLGSAAAFGQTLPIKEGLWENKVLNDDGSVAVHSMDCVTKKSITDTLLKATKHPGCTVTNQTITSRGMTLDVSCKESHIQMTEHAVIELPDAEHSRTTVMLKMTIDGNTNESTTRSTSRYLKSDCGNIRPGDPKTLDE